MNGSTLKKVNNIREIFESPFSCLSWTSTYVNKTDVVLKSFLELSNFLCFHSPLFNNFPAVICTWNLQWKIYSGEKVLWRRRTGKSSMQLQDLTREGARCDEKVRESVPRVRCEVCRETRPVIRFESPRCVKWDMAESDEKVLESFFPRPLQYLMRNGKERRKGSRIFFWDFIVITSPL